MDDIKRIDLVDIELTGGSLHRSWCKHSIGKSDIKANAFGVRVFRDGEAVNLSGGSVQGHFLDSQGNKIAITDNSFQHVAGNVAYIILPQACYNYEGQFTLAIKLINSSLGITGTMRIVDGMVDNTNTGGSVAPTGSVPTYEQVLSVFGEMEDALEAADNFLNYSVANTYSGTATYAVGDYVIYNGKLYRCNTAITTAEADFVPGHWTACTAMGQVNGLRTDVAPAYNSSTTYAAGDYVSYNRYFWRSKVDSNTGHTPASGSYWQQVDIANDLKAKLAAETTARTEADSSLLSALDTFELVMEDDKFIDYINGELTNTYWSLSNKYPIVEGMQVKVSTHILYGGVIGFFDEDDKMLSYTINPDGTMYSGIENYILTAPQGSAYVRFSCWKTSKSGAKISIYNFVNGTIESLKGASNLVIKRVQASDIIANNLLTRDGSLASTDLWDATDYLPIYPNGNITLNTYIYLNGALCYYDKNKNLLLGIDGNNATDYGYASSTSEQLITVTPPTGTKYIRMCIWKTYGSITDLFAMYSAPWSENAQNILETVDSVSDIADGYSDKKVLVIGDSISADAYQNYKKWVTNLIDEGKFKFANVVNSSQHATGFVATSNGSYPNFITRLEAVEDKSTFDLVVVFGGINDYIQNIPLGETGQDKTVYFKPAVDYFFQYLVNNFTQARICVLLPLMIYNTNPNTAGNKQEVYGEYIHDVAKHYCLPVLNLTEESGFCPFIDSFKTKWTLVPSGYTDPDGVHPNAQYEKEYLAPMIWKFISGLIN